MKGKYVLAILIFIIAGVIGYYYVNSDMDISQKITLPSIGDPNTKICILSNVKWGISTKVGFKVKDFEGNYWWAPDVDWNYGEGNKTYEITESDKLKISRISLSMRYTAFDEIPNNAFLGLQIIKRGKLIFNKIVNDNTYITWEPWNP